MQLVIARVTQVLVIRKNVSLHIIQVVELPYFLQFVIVVGATHNPPSKKKPDSHLVHANGEVPAVSKQFALLLAQLIAPEVPSTKLLFAKQVAHLLKAV